MTYEEYRRAKERFNELMDKEPGGPEDKELVELADKILFYEEIHYPIAKPCWLSRVIFRIRQKMGW